MIAKLVQSVDPEVFDSKLREVIANLEKLKYNSIDIQFSTCSKLHNDVLFSALVIAR